MAKFVHAFPTGKAKPAELAQQLKTAIADAKGIRVNEVCFVATDVRLKDASMAAQIAAASLGDEQDSFKRMLNDPQKLLELIAAAQGSHSGSGGGDGGFGGPSGGGGTGTATAQEQDQDGPEQAPERALVAEQDRVGGAGGVGPGTRRGNRIRNGRNRAPERALVAERDLVGEQAARARGRGGEQASGAGGTGSGTGAGGGTGSGWGAGGSGPERGRGTGSGAGGTGSGGHGIWLGSRRLGPGTRRGNRIRNGREQAPERALMAERDLVGEQAARARNAEGEQDQERAEQAPERGLVAERDLVGEQAARARNAEGEQDQERAEQAPERALVAERDLVGEQAARARNAEGEQDQERAEQAPERELVAEQDRLGSRRLGPGTQSGNRFRYGRWRRNRLGRRNGIPEFIRKWPRGWWRRRNLGQRRHRRQIVGGSGSGSDSGSVSSYSGGGGIGILLGNESSNGPDLAQAQVAEHAAAVEAKPGAVAGGGTGFGVSEPGEEGSTAFCGH